MEILKTPVLSVLRMLRAHGPLQFPKCLDGVLSVRIGCCPRQYLVFALFCFSHPLLLFPRPRRFCLKDRRHDRDRGRSPQMTEDEPPREMDSLQTSEPKVGLSEWPPAPAERLRLRSQKPDGMEPAWSRAAPGHRCSCWKVTMQVSSGKRLSPGSAHRHVATFSSWSFGSFSRLLSRLQEATVRAPYLSGPQTPLF